MPLSFGKINEYIVKIKIEKKKVSKQYPSSVVGFLCDK